MSGDEDDQRLITGWRGMIASNAGWVLFSHGTGVLITEPCDDPVGCAIDLLADWGPVRAGTSSGDFNVIPLRNGAGWAVTCHHAAIVTFVPRTAFAGETPTDLAIGLMGRSSRDLDAQTLRVLHCKPLEPSAT